MKKVTAEMQNKNSPNAKTQELKIPHKENPVVDAMLGKGSQNVGEIGKEMPTINTPQESWRLTPNLRWLQVPGEDGNMTYNLQQQIHSNHGNSQWQNVPMMAVDAENNKRK